jgi:hypothetical protein
MDCNKLIEKCGMCGHTMAELKVALPDQWVMTDSPRQLEVGQCCHSFCFFCVEHMINLHNCVGGTIDCPTCLEPITDFIEHQILHDDDSDGETCDEETCDACGLSWRDDVPGNETCNCWCMNCERLSDIHGTLHCLMRDCRYTCFDKTVEQLLVEADEVRNTCDCCAESWKDDQPEDETCNCIHSECDNLLRYCRYTCRKGWVTL